MDKLILKEYKAYSIFGFCVAFFLQHRKNFNWLFYLFYFIYFFINNISNQKPITQFEKVLNLNNNTTMFE